MNGGSSQAGPGPYGPGPQGTSTDERSAQGPGTADQAKQEARQTAGQAKEHAGAATETAKGEAKEVMTEAKSQMRSIATEAKQVGRARADEQTERLAGALHQVHGQAQALLDGRTDEAGALGDYARQLNDRVGRYADRVDEMGFDGLVREVSRFARRRPGAFLLAAAGTGLVVGRLGRGASDAQRDDADAAALPPRTGSTTVPPAPAAPPPVVTDVPPGPVTAPPSGVGTAPLSSAGTGAAPRTGGDQGAGPTVDDELLADPLDDRGDRYGR